MQCAKHPETETSLSCGRCGDPICPKCMVHSLVGVRCRECGLGKPVPTYDISKGDLFKASLTGLGIAVGSALLFVFLSIVIFSIPFLPFLALVGIGYAVGEGISASVNRKRGRGLQIVATASMIVSYAVILSIMGVVAQIFLRGLFGLLALGVAVYIAIGRVK